MTLPETSGVSNIPKRRDEDLPWVLDPDRLENWSDEEMYQLEISFREWLFKAMKNTTWKVPPGRGKWNVGSRMTFNKIREQFDVRATDYQLMAKLRKLCKHYATKVRHGKNPIESHGKKQSQTGYYLPRYPRHVKKPYNLRLRFELLMEEGEEVVDLRSLPMPRRAEQDLAEMDGTRRLQNAKSAEYYQRWKEKYGDRYNYNNVPTDEDTDSGS